MKKVCPVCGSDNGPNDTVCVNCSASLTGNQKMVDRSPTPKGEQGNPLGHVTAQGVMPTNPNVVKRDMPESMNRRVKRQPVYRELSDDFVDSIEDEHLDQVQHSADHLGL
tara:strand:+ start:34961 stop:35290 length:330 start_codon:yes stop_codon:yes gene_type:complete